MSKSCNEVKDTKEPLLPHDAGRVPLTGASIASDTREGNAPLGPHVDGKVPACMSETLGSFD